jgi:hypothetical protein
VCTLVASAALIVPWGCGGEAPKPATDNSPKSEATVTGTVTINGKPASKGRLNFEPLGSDGMPTGSQVTQVSKDGTYNVTTKTGDNDVTISSTGNAAIDSGYNKTKFTVKPGTNSLNIELPLKP